MTAGFTDSNIDRAGREYTNQPGASLRGHFAYGLLAGGAQTLSWNAAGITQNADGTNMDDELLASIRVIYIFRVPEPPTLALVGLAGVLVLRRRAPRRKPLDRVGHGRQA